MFDDHKEYICVCGEVCNPVSSEWRWDGKYWQHYHGYPMGHVHVFKREKADCPVV